jgi:hypothetical protein
MGKGVLIIEKEFSSLMEKFRGRLDKLLDIWNPNKNPFANVYQVKLIVKFVRNIEDVTLDKLYLDTGIC